MPPEGFSWIEQSRLAGMARPESAEDLAWLRGQGIELLISLTEEPPPRTWINEAGLFLLHLPIEDFSTPSLEALDQAVTTIHKALGQKRGVAIHCGAGLGRTGTVLACYLVSQGLSPTEALAQLRELRPGSVETLEQEEVVQAFSRYWRQKTKALPHHHDKSTE